MDREDLDFVLDVTNFKTKEPWGEDPWKPVPGPVKGALTRALHAASTRPRCNIAVEEFKKGRKSKRGAPAAPADDEGIATGAATLALNPKTHTVRLLAMRSTRGARASTACRPRRPTTGASAQARPAHQGQGGPLTGIQRHAQRQGRPAKGVEACAFCLNQASAVTPARRLCRRAAPAANRRQAHRRVVEFTSSPIHLFLAFAPAGGDPELEAMEAANAPAAAGDEEEEADELTAGEEATVRRLETAARKGRFNFQPKVEVKVTLKPSTLTLKTLHPGRVRACVLSFSGLRVCPSM